MGIAGVLERLDAAGIRLGTQDGQLQISAPKGAMTAELKTLLVEYKAELLRLLERSANDGAAAPMPSVARDGVLPLSPAQQRLWFLDQFDGGSAAYNKLVPLRLTGTVDVSAVRRAVDAIVSRHEALRCAFVAERGEPLVRVVESLHVDVGVHDVAADAVPAWIDAEARRPFALDTPPLLRVNLLRQDPQHHVLLLAIHHIVSDGWSMGVLVREFSALYAAFCAGKPAPLAPLPIQYIDYAAWQHARLRDGARLRDLAYWREQLDQAPALLELPTDRPRPAEQGFAGNTISFTLPLATSTALHSLAQREGVSLFMLLQAAFKLLLARYSGQRDISVGTPTANRERAELEGLIGFFVNTVVLRDRLDDAQSFSALLQQVKHTTLNAFRHQAVSFEQLVESLQPQRSLSHAPLFQVMFALQNAPLGELQLPGLNVELLAADTHSAKFDLSMELEETAAGLRGLVEYATDLFDRQSIERLIGHYRHLLEQIVAAPGRALGDFELATPEERAVLLGGIDTPADDERRCVHDLVAAQAGCTPAATAIEFDGCRVSYAELEIKANALAAMLVAHGVGPGQRIGLCLHRSPMLLVALLGVLKSGAAYVPLDPSYPVDRIAYALDDAGVSLLITQSALADQAWAQRDVWLLDVLEPPAYVPRISARGGQRDLAYLIYTSGSTGRPKGVAIEHRSVVAFLQAMEHSPGMAAQDRLLAVTTLAFDIAVLELLLPLTCGACVILADGDTAADGAQLRKLLQSSRASVMQATPATWKMLLAAGWIPTPSLRVLSGGEALSRDLADALCRDNVEVWNMYGPTEATVWVAADRVDVASPWRVAPIGGVIAGTQCLVLDDGLRVLPVGVPGQLYLRGTSLARGYWQRPELDAQAFLPDPWAQGSRLYRSGDRARWRNDGKLEFLGRIDQQIKLRGFRIELGEIEHALLSHPAVREAVVLVREDRPGDPQLAAYVVCHAECAAATLRDALRQRLPDYMLPAAFVFLDSLPLTANGKIDRKALPAPEGQVEDIGYVAPRDALETAVAAIWCDVLKRDRLGVHEDFFASGGHSLLATQVMARVRERHGVEWPVKTLFEAPTIAQFAARLAGQSPQAVSNALLRADRAQALPLSFAQQRVWFLEQLDGPSATYNIPVVIDLAGDLHREPLRAALQDIVDRHEALRTAFIEVDGLVQQRILGRAEIALPCIDVAEADVAHCIERDALAPFDLAQAPLIRAQLLRVDATRHVLLVTLHHIVSDGWSLGLLVKELGAGYRARLQGAPAELPALAVQYADYAHWQRAHLQGQALQAEVDYWKGALADLPSLLPLPTDRPRPPVQTHAGALETRTLPAALTPRLQSLAQANGATLYMLLLAAFDILLARYTGSTDIAVGSSIANRPRRELEDLIGFFVNTLIVRTQVDERQPFSELLRQVRERVLDAYAHQDVPFERLVEELQPQRSLSHSPWFQVMLVLQNTPMETLSLPGLELRVRDPYVAVAKYDLSLYVTEGVDGLRLDLEYNTDLFDVETVRALLRHFGNLLEGIASDDGQSIAQLPMLDAQEIARQLHGEMLPAEKGDVLARFDMQVAATPHATAVRLADESLDYAALDACANRIAHWLRDQGIGADDRVAVCVERTPDLIAALLGVLKAGAAYVPLDPRAPAGRNTFVLDDAHCRCVLTQTMLGANFPQRDRSVLCIDAAETMSALPGSPVSCSAHPQSLAYVIYTSGSTGRPKGVAVSRGALAAFCAAAIERYAIESADRVLQFANAAFDASIEEIFPTLLSGAILVLREEGMVDTLGDFVTRSATLGITVWDLPTAFWQQLVADGVWLKKLPASLRLVIIGGERADAARVAAWQRDVGARVRLFNTYGPTEATVVATAAELKPGDVVGRSVSIGTPLRHTQCYVLDQYLRPVAPGASGELYIGGAALARGYLQRADQTAASFVPHPYARHAGERLYRSGDLVRYGRDGGLEFIGRADHQVKIRGFRVEPAEVEAVLQAQSGVRQAFVRAQADAQGRIFLAAYAATDLGEEALLAALREILPDYLVPSALVCLPALPLNRNGKVDAKSLPDVTASTQRLRAYVAPTTQREIALAAIWSEVLGLEQVGIHDNFFQVGGHSLLATQVVSRVREQLKLAVSIKTLFEKPTVAELALLDTQAIRPGEHPVVPVPRDGAIPLSFAQQRLWFLDQLEGSSSTYSMPGAFRLLGDLDVAAMRRAVQALVDRHESLRTTFAPMRGEPVQRIAARQVFDLPLRDVSAAQFAELVQPFFDAPFELARGPLLRLELLRLAAQEHVLLLNMHHIISDAWSVGVLVNELVELYSAEVEARPARLAPLPVQYADFAHWQRAWLQGEALERQVAYWRERLADLPPLLELPTDFPRPAVQRYRGRQALFSVSPDLLRGLKSLAKAEGATLFMLLMAAYQVLLARHAGQDDIAVGTPIANRVRPELEGLIGFFVNTLVLRSRVTAQRRFRDLLAELRGHTLSAYSHQDVPFEHLVSELNPERSLSHAPLFQVMFVLQNAPVGAIDLPGLKLLPAEGEATISKFDLRLDLQEQGDGLHGILEYNTDLFAAESMQRFIAHYLRLLQGIVAAPETRVGDLPMLDEPEREQVLQRWNATAAPYPGQRLIHECVADQARRTPAAPALVFEDRALSYAEFNARANRLARHLRSLGVKPDCIVAVCCERSLEMVIALHAILRAGGAYLPIDPSYPADRLEYLLSDSRPHAVLTHAAVPAGVQAQLRAHVSIVCDLDADAAWQDQSDADLPRAETCLSPAHLAYAIYTSGSTGRPKGTMNSHAGILNRLQWMQSAYPLDASDRVLQKTPYSFDVSVWEFFWPLMFGATLVIARPEGHRDPGYLRELIAAQHVTTLHFVPSMLQVFVGEPDIGGLTCLRRVICSGEALPAMLARRFLELLPHSELHNLYGPTEAAVDVSYWPCRRDNLERGVPIGFPIGNIRLYILDEALRPVPIGVRGQLFISGIGLGRGYLGRSDLTASSFLPDPYAGEPGARMYRTGDLARHAADGAIEYIRRIDTQVKIRGFRIELGEIETRLAEHAAVREAVLLAREDSPGDQRLVAYLTLQDAALESAGEALESEQVQQWSELYDQTYSAPVEDAEAAFNLVGWNSSYTREPIDDAQMRDWLDGALSRIHALQPKRVLEIGCGTGLILFGVAPQVQRYVGTDLSRATVEQLQQRLARDADAGHTRVVHAQASDFAAIGEGGFDTVVLNSVVQYFPGIDYLREVIAGAIAAIDGAGRIFLGDVRHHRLLEAFHWSVQLHQADAATPVAELQARVLQKVQGESELLVDPTWFAQLAETLPAITGVDVLPKAGGYRNEMSAFRYDVVLHVRGETAQPTALTWIDAADATAQQIFDRVAAAQGEMVGVRHIANPRLSRDVAIVRGIAGGTPPRDAAALRDAVHAMPERGIASGDLLAWCAQQGLQAQLSWLPTADDGSYHALIGRTALPRFDWRSLDGALPARFANDPLRAKRIAALPAQLSAHLGASLPDYMLPAAYVFLEQLPVTANGKLDRRALPAPEYRADEAYVAPGNAIEIQLAQIWAQVLRLPRVGVTDNFFAAGGHSLLATQVVSRLRKALGVEIGVRQLFETPTIAGLAAHVAQLGRRADETPLLPIARGSDAPLSFAQQRLWFLDQLEGPSATYNMPAALRLSGRLNVGALRGAVQGVVDRHETLRTCFVEVDGEAMQRIAASATIDIAVIDVAEKDLQARAQAFAAEPFDLQSGPLLRAQLLRIAPDEHVLLTNMHHIISDGWSIGVLVSEFVALYEAACRGVTAALAELPIQYADFAHWQRQRLQGDIASRQLGYWREQLRDMPALLELPYDRPRPALQSYVGALHAFTIPAALADALRKLCQDEQSSLFMGLLAAFQILLARYAGQNDIAVGTPIANRTRQELESLIGFFVNTLVLRGRVDANQGFRSLLAQARATTLAAYDHQDLPFEQLVEALKPERSLSHSPLFQVMFALQNNRRYDVELPHLRVALVEPDARVAKFDLSLELEEVDGSIAGTLEYNVDLFDAASMARFADHYVRLLAAVVANPAQALAGLRLCDEPAQQDWLRECRTPAPADATAQCLHERFADWARRSPDAQALVIGDKCWTYAELNLRADRWAQRLLDAGVKAEDIVAVNLAPGIDLVAALLGVLKAGGAYLVVDPELPAQRLALMLACARPRCVIGRNEMAGVPLLHVDADVAVSSDALPVVVNPEQLAYVIFTSGSTGVPKGVMVEHARANALLQGFDAMAPARAPGAASVLTPFGFDVSVWELFGALCNGHAAHLISRELVLEPEQLADYWRAQDIRTAYLPPALIEPIAAAWEAEPGRAVLERLLVGVEPIAATLLARLRAVNLQLVVINGYGPTETAVCATFHRSTDADRGIVPIGRAVPGYAVYLLDSLMQPAPVGVVGEIHIGGAGVARGYLDDAPLTAQRFVPDPYSSQPGARCYRSGDLARRRADGSLQFAGRRDAQVKLRGFRIELGEIEAALAVQNGVTGAVVVVHEQRLIAYIVTDGAIVADELREALRLRLPDYMLPAAFVFLDALPVTANGKVDRKALALPHFDAAAATVAPRNAMEAELAAIFGEVLQREAVSVRGNFFDLGGHSLLATQVVSRVRRQLGRDVPVRQLFDTPSVEGLAAWIAARGDVASGPPLLPVPRDRDLPLSFAQQRLWFLDQLQGPNPTYNMPAALRLQGALDVPALVASIQAIVDRHESLRTHFGQEQGVPVQVITAVSPVGIPQHDVAFDAVEAHARRFAEAPFDLATGPLFRAELLRVAADDHVLLTNMHHIVSDGWSTGVLVNEFVELYSAQVERRESALPALPVQYADFAHWQREWLAGAELERQVAYWKNTLAGLPPLLELPTDRPRPALQSFRGAHWHFVLDADLVHGLERLSRRHGATLFMTLLAAFQWLLSRYAGQDDVAVGTPVANRRRAELEGLIGFFVNTLVLRTRIDESQSFAALLAQVRQITLGAYDHQDVPHERLVEELNPERSMSHSPLFQVMLALQNTARSAQTLPGLQLSPLDGEGDLAKFDLELNLEENAGGLAARLTYNADLFSAARMQRLAAHWTHLLRQILARSTAPLAELSMIEPAERSLLLDDWTATGSAYPRDASLAALFEAQVQRTPDAVALRHRDQAFSYRDLARRARQLSHVLVARGIVRGDRVGICLRPQADLIVAMLAVLRAGAAYVPLDANAPAERLGFLCADARIGLVIGETATLDAIGDLGTACIALDTLELPIDDRDVAMPDVGGADAAYVIYTSGSTGQPKGVRVPQRAVSRLVLDTDYVDLRPGMRIAQASNVAFDAATFEIWGALLNGAELVIVEQHVLLDPHELAQCIAGQGIGVLFLTTALFNLVAEQAPQAFAPLQTLLFGGEAVDPRWVREVLRQGPPQHLLHVYGPTENTTFSTWHEVREVDETALTVPIGKPIRNSLCYVLDAACQPVPVGVAGELYVGGDGLAIDYLHRPELTEERFVTSPFDANARLYRTGDKVRWRDDGTLEFLARLDDQVKLRGFRIELGEIEAALTALPQISGAVVLVREAPSGDKRLVAWVVADGTVAATGVREALRTRLPDYMLPAAFVFMDALPLNANGKVDKRALPEPQLESNDYVAPHTPTEIALAAIWAEVLRIERVGVHDNFFEIGGHSLLATQIVVRLRRQLQASLPVQRLFETPTVHALAAYLDLSRDLVVASSDDGHADREEIEL